jgi:DNA-binding transcriptional MocR family regulator
MDIVWLMREQLKTQPDAVAVGDGFPPVEWLADVRLDKYHPKVVRTGLGALFRYGSRFGYAPLRDHLVRKLADFGIGAEPRQIVLTHGANEAMDIVIRYFVPPGGKVLVDDPGYYPLFGKLKLAGAQMLAVPRLADGPDLDVLEQLLIAERPRLFFTQSLAHNPTGSDISPAKAFRVLQLAQKYDLLIVENDPLADFKPTALPRLSALDQLERTIYIGSFSKSFSAALRVGFIACGADLASDLADLKALIHVSSSEYSERTVDVILSEGHYQRHLNRLQTRLGEATRKALQLFDSVDAEVFARTPQSLYIWAALPGVADSLAFREGTAAAQDRDGAGAHLQRRFDAGLALVALQRRRDGRPAFREGAAHRAAKARLNQPLKAPCRPAPPVKRAAPASPSAKTIGTPCAPSRRSASASGMSHCS